MSRMYVLWQGLFTALEWGACDLPSLHVWADTSGDKANVLLDLDAALQENKEVCVESDLRAIVLGIGTFSRFLLDLAARTMSGYTMTPDECVDLRSRCRVAFCSVPANLGPDDNEWHKKIVKDL